MKSCLKWFFQRGLLLFFSVTILDGCVSRDAKIFNTVKPLHKKLQYLTRLFSEIESYEELEKKRMKVRKLYLEIAEEMIKADQTLKQLDDFAPIHSEELYQELQRLYMIEGLRELLEDIQKDALIKWDQALESG